MSRNLDITDLSHWSRCSEARWKRGQTMWKYWSVETLQVSCTNLCAFKDWRHRFNINLQIGGGVMVECSIISDVLRSPILFCQASNCAKRNIQAACARWMRLVSRCINWLPLSTLVAFHGQTSGHVPIWSVWGEFQECSDWRVYRNNFRCVALWSNCLTPIFSSHFRQISARASGVQMAKDSRKNELNRNGDLASRKLLSLAQGYHSLRRKHTTLDLQSLVTWTWASGYIWIIRHGMLGETPNWQAYSLGMFGSRRKEVS